MGLFKKNPIFILIVVLSVLVAISGGVLTFLQLGKISKAASAYKSAEQQYRSMAYAEPSPTDANVEASKENVDALAEDLANIRDDLKRGANLDVSSDGVVVMAAIQQYISEYQSATADHLGPDGEPAPISTPQNFAFGFDRYIGEASVPGNRDTIPLIDKQRQILKDILDKLIASNPKSIDAVAREEVEVAASTGGNTQNNENRGFRIDPAISARVPGAIETMAFKVSFTGYTQSLRLFLNAMTEFNLPVVVRSINVERVAKANEKKAAPRNDLNSIFGVFGGQDTSATQEAPKPEAKPVISDNLSKYTLILEFIDIVLPAQVEEEPS